MRDYHGNVIYVNDYFSAMEWDALLSLAGDKWVGSELRVEAGQKGLT